MNNFPFSCVEEAKENARLLCRTLGYYSICRSDAPIGGKPANDISLQETQELMAQAFCCAGWNDLARRLALNSAAYYDQGKDPKPSHYALAERLGKILGTGVEVDAIYRAIATAALGCAPPARNQARRFFSNLPCRTAEQMGRLMQIESAYSYHSRYNRDRTAFEIRMLEYFRAKAVAEITGGTTPRKPRRRKIE